MVTKQIEQAEFARKVLYVVEYSEHAIENNEIAARVLSTTVRTQQCLDILESFALVRKNPTDHVTYSPTRRR